MPIEIYRHQKNKITDNRANRARSKSHKSEKIRLWIIARIALDRNYWNPEK